MLRKAKRGFWYLVGGMFPKWYSGYLYQKAFGCKLNLDEPSGLNEKLMWLKLNTYRSNPLVTRCSDKYAVRQYVEEAGCGNVRLCMETMGRVNVLGDLEEVIQICKSDERLLPCVDFGHLNARSQGGMFNLEDFTRALDRLEQELGERGRVFHAHFSKIEYSKGGEVRHLTFEDQQFGPNFDHLAGLLAQRGLSPHIICESAGTQDLDALAMKNMYKEECKRYGNQN